MTRRRLLIDVDTGTDDAVALLMALRSPAVEVLGVTVVAGNVPVDDGLRNTLGITELADAPAALPVARGASLPLIEPYRHARHVHGEEGLSGYRLPPNRRQADPRPAANFIVETLLVSHEPVTLVALAPLTNLALALRLRPEIADRIERLVIMGGSADGQGNATAAAEFNISVDPEAAWIAFHCGRPITMIGLDPCRPTAIPVDLAAGWRDAASPRLRFLATVLDHFAALGRERVPLYDAVAMTVALRPELAEVRRLPVEIELSAGHHRGAVLVDRRAFGRHEAAWPRVDVVFGVDVPAHERLMLELVE